MAARPLAVHLMNGNIKVKRLVVLHLLHCVGEESETQSKQWVKLPSLRFFSRFSTCNNYVLQGGPSNERWTPGDPLPWTASVCHGVPFTCALSYKRCLEIPDFETRSDDVFIVTYPKSGEVTCHGGTAIR